jgi:hypothetical protein
MYDTISVSRWGSATGSSRCLILLPRLERLAPAARASGDVDAFHRSGRSGYAETNGGPLAPSAGRASDGAQAARKRPCVRAGIRFEHRREGQ